MGPKLILTPLYARNLYIYQSSPWPFSLFLSIFFADLVLKDKVVVYDLANQRIGWTNYDCKFDNNYLPYVQTITAHEF